MRVAPAGVLWADDPPRLMRAVVEQARVTHHDPRCAAGAVAIAAASMVACRSDQLDPHEVCTELARLAAQVDAGVAPAIEKGGRLVAMDPMQATALVHREWPEAGSSRKWRGVSSEVTGSVCWSLYAFLRSPDDYWETVCTAIGAGGDTDTTAAMAGGIVGARVGLKGLPQALLARLNDQGEWKVAELTSVAQRCYKACRDRGGRRCRRPRRSHDYHCLRFDLSLAISRSGSPPSVGTSTTKLFDDFMSCSTSRYCLVKASAVSV